MCGFFFGIFSKINQNNKIMEVIENQEKSSTEYAGFWLRFVAYLIDYAVFSVAGLLIAIPTIFAIVGIAIGFEGIEEPTELLENGNLLKVGILVGIIVLVSIFSIVAGWLYYALFESSKYGGTLGKMAVGIKVTDIEGRRVSFARATGRYFARIVTNMTLLIGYIMAGFTEKKQALHDILANCLVVKK